MSPDEAARQHLDAYRFQRSQVRQYQQWNRERRMWVLDENMARARMAAEKELFRRAMAARRAMKPMMLQTAAE